MEGLGFSLEGLGLEGLGFSRGGFGVAGFRASQQVLAAVRVGPDFEGA